MFGRKKKISIPEFAYDPKIHEAIMKSSICTGERVVGFKDKATGKFTELFMVRSDEELDAFMEKYDLKDIKKVF